MKNIPKYWRFIIVGVSIIWLGVFCFGIKTAFFQQGSPTVSQDEIKWAYPEWWDKYHVLAEVPLKIGIVDSENNELGIFTLEVERTEKFKIVKILFDDSELFKFFIPNKNKTEVLK